MAGRDQEFASVYEEFISKGFTRETISDEIDAWRYNPGAKNISSLRSHLNKQLKVPKSFNPAPQTVVSVPNLPSLITTFPSNYILDDTLIPITNLQVLVNEIRDEYFLEEQTKIDICFKNHLKIVQENFVESYSVRLGNVFESGEEEVWTVGRVELNDDDEQESYNIVMENEKCALNLMNLDSFAVFPGQIVLAKGTMQSMSFNANFIESKSFGEFENETKLNRKVKVGLVSGPFTGPDLDFSDFLSAVSALALEVNVLIVVGPIVDCENEKIKTCNLTIPSLRIENGTFEMVFESISKFLEGLKIAVVIVPHEREAVHLFPLPMPGLNRSVSTNLICSPSPGFLSINNLQVHVVPYDIVHDITQSLYIKSNSLVNKTQIALSQLIHQQCYLPLIPNNLPVEYSNFNHFVFGALPEVLIVNTKLSVQPDTVPGVTCVKTNPFIDGSRRGNYTIINATPTEEKALVGVKNYRANF